MKWCLASCLQQTMWALILDSQTNDWTQVSTELLMCVYTVHTAYWSLFFIVRSSCNCESILRETAQVSVFFFFNILNTWSLCGMHIIVSMLHLYYTHIISLSLCWKSKLTQARHICMYVWCLLSRQTTCTFCRVAWQASWCLTCWPDTRTDAWGRTRSRMAGWVSHALFSVCFEPVTEGIAWSSELVGDRQSLAPLTANERPHTLQPNERQKTVFKH